MRISSLLILIPLGLLTGCGQGNDHVRSYTQPYIVGQTPPKHSPYSKAIIAKSTEIEKAKIEAQTKEKIAQIEKEKEIGVQKIKSTTDLSRADTDKEIALKQLETQEITIEKEQETKKLALEKEHEYRLGMLALFGAAILSLFGYLFYNSHTKRKHEREEQERERLLKLQMQEQELKMQMAKEMLGALSSDKIPPEQKNRLIETIHHTTSGHLIEHKP